MKRRYAVWAGIALVLALAATAVWAVPGMGRHRQRARGGHGPGLMARQLDLSQEQVAQAKAIADQEKARTEQAREALKAARQEMRAATAGGRFDEAQVRAIAAKEAKALTDLIVSHQRVKSRVYQEVLTSEQRAKADALHQQWEQGRAQWRERRGACEPMPGRRHGLARGRHFTS